MSFQLRLAAPADEGAIADLIRASVFALLPAFYAPRVLEGAMGSSFGLDRRLIADGTYFVVERDGRVVGCGGWSKRRATFGADTARADGDDELLDPATDAARIRAFFVHPAFARQGVGTLILRACERAIAAAGFTRVQIAATSAGELLYATFGYETVDRSEHPLPNGEAITVIHMTKALPP